MAYVNAYVPKTKKALRDAGLFTSESDGARTRNLWIDSPNGHSVTAISLATYGIAETDVSNRRSNAPDHDAQLNQIIDAWPNLSNRTRRAVLRLVTND